jgi:hypothetical protein
MYTLSIFLCESLLFHLQTEKKNVKFVKIELSPIPQAYTLNSIIRSNCYHIGQYISVLHMIERSKIIVMTTHRMVLYVSVLSMEKN